MRSAARERRFSLRGITVSVSYPYRVSGQEVPLQVQTTAVASRPASLYPPIGDNANRMLARPHKTHIA